MGLDRKALRGAARLSSAFLLSLIFVFATVSLAFGDFAPPSDSKTLGVGRIQSTLPEAPVALESKFAVVSAEAHVEQTFELAAPIAREVAPAVLSMPALPASAPVVVSPGDGWRTTMATNYGTPGDGFLNCTTAYGTTTTTTSMGVAHKSLPLGTMIEIYCPQSGLSCIAMVDDRGPYGGYWGTQPDTFDLQMGVTAALGNNYGWYQVLYRII